MTRAFSFLRAQQIDLVERRDGRRTRWLFETGCLLERRRLSLARITHVDNAVSVGECGDGGRLHRSLQEVVRVEQPRGIGQDHLRIALGADADDSVARGLGLVACDAQLLADEPVEER